MESSSNNFNADNDISSDEIDDLDSSKIGYDLKVSCKLLIKYNSFKPLYYNIDNLAS